MLRLCVVALLAAAASASNAEGLAFLEAKKAESGVVALASGLLYKVIRKGAGKAHPLVGTSCECHYEGTLIDGTKFDSSYDRGSPTTFAPNQVIKGWTEAMQLMVEGDLWEMYIPSDLGYGARGSPPKIGADNVLVFKMEILGIQGASKPAISCNVATFEDCDEKEKAFVEKIKAKGSAAAELARLEGMKAKPMKSELKSWLDTRVHLLTKMNDEL